jgi:hypothetical protein
MPKATQVTARIRARKGKRSKGNEGKGRQSKE